MLFTLAYDREQWDVDVPTYIPQFKCGFKPQPEQYHPTLFDDPSYRNNPVNGGMVGLNLNLLDNYSCFRIFLASKCF